ncbi:Primosomal protein N' (replication factor Y) - superfamily II helicase [Clostridiaceae bacterium JG1575]|nr:Primosomal protein N' (replication factor Y) - superfamily II helicase [Clostridiaceae bacterium JG1575]
MASSVTNYQCPSCTGPLHFHGATGKLKCDYCSAEYEVAEVEEMFAKKEEAARAAGTPSKEEAEFQKAAHGWSDDEAERLRAYGCPSCGAELICTENTAASTCPYCGNPTVVPSALTGGAMPDAVIPFVLDQQAAKQALQNYYKGKKFLPKTFAAQNHIDEIQGVYVPFWLFDGEAYGDMVYRATKVHKRQTQSEKIEITEHYDIYRKGHLSFEMVPVDASSKMPDEHMDAIEPYTYENLQEFSTAYLPGYFADTYDEDEEKCSERAQDRISQSVKDAFRKSVKGYSSVTQKKEEISVSMDPATYAFFPVWLLSTKWEGKNYLFAMNGQTGKLVGDLPVDRKLFWLWFAGIALPLMAILSFVLLGGIL